MPSTAVNAESMSSLEWSVAVLQPYIRVGVVARPTDYNRSWQNGVALLCLVHLVDASLVPDMDAIVRWLGTSSLAPDHDEHIRVLKSLKVVYSASVDTWMQTCQRALAIANKLVGVSLSHNDLAQLKCSQEEVIQLMLSAVVLATDSIQPQLHLLRVR
ncbi:hypothetical protein BC830DRAFT_677524 [Chytriomyces sp. MP71]|nr:hypothetical protein BC830DRAFT_677524 [Chytriomyces sp. MP71]